MKILSLFKFVNKKTTKYPSGNLVLIGTLKSNKQLEISMRENFYHIPLNSLVPDVFPSWKKISQIKYVSVYQSVNLFKENAGIKYFGKVENVSVVKRREITSLPKESNSLYALFKVSSWEELTMPIKCTEVGIYPFKIVSFENFKASQTTAELFLETAEDRELYRNLARLSVDVNFRNFSYGEFDFEDYNDNLIIRKNNVCYLQLPMEVIRELPLSGFETVKNALEE